MSLQIPRHRDRSSVGPNTSSTLKVGLAQNPVATLSFPQYTTEEEMDDVLSPGYNKRRAAGEVIMNPAFYVKTSVTRSGAGSLSQSKTDGTDLSTITGSASLTSFWRQFRGVEGYTQLTSGLTSAAISQQAQQRALENIDRTPYAFAEDIATVQQTIKFLRQPFKGIGDLAKSFQKTVSKRRAKHSNLLRAQYLASVWLEYRFAFSPLIMSVSNFIEALEDTEIKRVAKNTARGSSTGQYSKSDVQAVTAGIATSRWSRKIVAEETWRAMVLYEIVNPLTDWRFKYGLRNKEIPRLLWDLFPYSFMIDRVFNIGTSLTGLANLTDPDIHLKVGCITVKSETAETYSFVSRVATGWNPAVIVPSVDTFTRFTFERAIWQPTLLSTLPGFFPRNLVNDITKIADLSTLVLQRIR